jgi:hypothetical protein
LDCRLLLDPFQCKSAAYPEVASAFDGRWLAQLLEQPRSKWWACRLFSPNFGLRTTQVENERSWMVDLSLILFSSTPAAYPEVASAFEGRWLSELLEYTCQSGSRNVTCFHKDPVNGRLIATRKDLGWYLFVGSSSVVYPLPAQKVVAHERVGGLLQNSNSQGHSSGRNVACFHKNPTNGPLIARTKGYRMKIFSGASSAVHPLPAQRY